MKKLFLLFIIVFISCNSEKPTQFSDEAYQEILIDINNSKTSLRDVLSDHKGKKILIDVWASWCKDCIASVTKIKELQKEFPNVTFLFLSVDKNNLSWKRAINKYNLIGKHYNLPEGMKDGKFVNFINLNWIPRYMVINETGEISLFKAINTADKKLKEALKKIK